VPLFLKVIGITNAAAWFGAAVFLILAVWPAFGTSEMLQILPQAYSGAVAQVVLERYFLFQYWCGGIALGHLVLEWLYTGRPLRNWTRHLSLYLVAGLLGLTLFGGMVLQPRLKRLHFELYGPRSTELQRQNAQRSMAVWRGVMGLSNLIMAGGLWVYLWQVKSGTNTARFVSASPLRGLTNGVS
jgi:hypothetical protein